MYFTFEGFEVPYDVLFSRGKQKEILEKKSVS